MAEKFTQEEAAQLRRLLEKVRHNQFWWPDEETMRALHATVSMWATELVMTRKGGAGETEVFLTRYEGGIEELVGFWHIPGGYNRWDEAIEQTCSRVARRELGIGIIFESVMDALKWGPGEHPYGRPLSVFCRCKGEPAETGNRRWFPVSKLPDKLVEIHRRFIQEKLNGV